MKKINFSTELCYVIGLPVLALGTAFMEKANLGMSMVVAPSYIMYLKLSEYCPWLTFGMSCYIFQALLLLFMMLLLHKARISYLFSFVTAVLYGFVLDGWLYVLHGFAPGTLPQRIMCYTGGILLCALGVAFIFRTYIAPEVYELFVMEYAQEKNITTSRCKTAYDCISCLAAVIMSFAFFGWLHFEGIGIGTILCALVNGSLIGLFGHLLDQVLSFRDVLPLRKFFK